MLNHTCPSISVNVAAAISLAGLLIACSGPEEDPTQTPDGPDISLLSAELSTSSATLGDSVEVIASLENTGDRPGSHTLEFQVDGTTIHTLTRHVDATLDDTPGTRDVTFRWSPDAAGDFSFAVNDLDAGTLSVTSPEPDLQLAGISSEQDLDDPHPIDEPLTLLALLENVGAASGDLTLTLTADDDPVDDVTVTVPAGTSFAEPLTWTPSTAGTFALEVNDLDAGAVTVAAPPTIDLLEPTNEPQEFVLIQGEDDNGLYAELTFSASTSDASDDLSWYTLADENDDGTPTSRHLGTGTDLTARLSSDRADCGALTEHLITVEASSPLGLSAELTHRVILQMGMC